MKDLNNIKKKTKEAGATSVLLSLIFDVNPSTVTGWNSNITQPTLQIIDEIAKFLEFENCDLIISKKRKQTGLAKATQAEFKKLLASGISHKVPSTDKDGNPIEINNPELIKLLWNFVENYKKKHK
ncbi:hypothetical protein [Sphingobacterium faecium]|uniref:hypothetical protein n=1 Tax=Sphingobacterium faecium TaxID=34087 RepID=UPI002468F578|nr:hypothetical protein [Sphingobacterium faecium]MDH5827777.1 hypothetical protein [Sphingobacterium faecium]